MADVASPPAGALPRARPRLASRPALLLLPLLVLYLVVCAFGQPGGDPVRDEPDLLAAAARLLHGQLVPVGPPLTPRAYLWHGPGLAVLLAPLVALDLPLQAIRFVEPLLLGSAVLLFHRLLRIRLARRPALIGSYAFGLYLPFLAVVSSVHKEPLAILIVVAGMFALSRGLASGRRRWLAASGACLAALAMVRLEYGWVTFALLAAALLTWAIRRHSLIARRLVVVTVIASALCLPWLTYTHHLTGQYAYWGSSSGLSLFWMSPTLPGETGQWHSPTLVASDPALAAERPLFARVAALDPVAGDRLLREQARRNVAARPAAYVRNVIANLGRLLLSYPMKPTSVTTITVDGAWNVALLAGVIAAVGTGRRRRRDVPPEALPILVFAALSILVHLPASTSLRMLLPIAPALLWLAAVGAGRWSRVIPDQALGEPQR